MQTNGVLAVTQPVSVLHDADEFVGIFLVGKLLGLVVRLQTPLVGLGPDLKEMDFRIGVAVVLGVADTRTGAGELDLTALEVLEVAHAVLVLKDAVDNVAEDEELGMAVGTYLFVLATKYDYITATGYIPNPVPASTRSSLMTLSGPQLSCRGS